jgi:hypothetical protein
MVLVCILRQKNLVHTSPPYFLRIYFGTVLPFTRNVFNWSHPLQLCICVSYRSHAFCMLCPYYITRFVTVRTFGEGHRLCSCYYGVFCSLLLIYSLDILFSMLFSNTVSVLPLMWERPMRTKGRITFLCICIRYFLCRVQEKCKLVLH